MCSDGFAGRDKKTSFWFYVPKVEAGVGRKSGRDSFNVILCLSLGEKYARIRLADCRVGEKYVGDF